MVVVPALLVAILLLLWSAKYEDSAAGKAVLNLGLVCYTTCLAKDKSPTKEGHLCMVDLPMLSSLLFYRGDVARPSVVETNLIGRGYSISCSYK